MENAIVVDGGAIWAHDSGGSGTPIVLLHGGWTDSRIWAQLSRFLPLPQRVIYYDARGYGRSAPPTASFSQFEDAVTVLDQLGVSSALLVGHSGGGATALSLAVTHPERVAGLVLLAPGVSDYPWPTTDAYFTDFLAAYAAGDRAALVELGLRTWSPDDSSDDTRSMLGDAVDALFRYGGRCRPDPPAFDRLSDIGVPTSLIIGDQDHHSVVSCGAAVSERIPGCHTTVLPDVDHLIPLRVPGAIAATIARHTPARSTGS